MGEGAYNFSVSKELLEVANLSVWLLIGLITILGLITGWVSRKFKAIVKSAVREEVEPLKETLAELIALLANLYPDKAGDLVLLASNLYKEEEGGER